MFTDTPVRSKGKGLQPGHGRGGDVCLAGQGRAGGDQGMLHAADPLPMKRLGKFLVFWGGGGHFPLYLPHFISKPEEQLLSHLVLLFFLVLKM